MEKKKNRKKNRIVVLCLVLLLLCGLATGCFLNQNATEESQEESVQETVTEEPEEIEEDVAEEPTTVEPTYSYATTLFFTGDVMLKAALTDMYEANGIGALLSEYLLAQMVGADITMVNEEFPFSTRGTAMEDKTYTFRVDPTYVCILQEMGVDIVSLANNHSLDFGKEALLDSFTTLDEAGIFYAGAGETKERAEECIYFESNGLTIGYLAASRVIPVTSWNILNSQPGLFCTYDSTDLVAAIEEAKENCDYLVVYVHWGIERENYPEEYQRILAKAYIDAGADLVVGSHPHVPQGIEYYKGKPIVYSLGNFIFNMNMVDTYALKVNFSLEEGASLQVIPVSISKGYTSELTGSKAAEMLAYIQELSFGVVIDEDGYVTEE